MPDGFAPTSVLVCQVGGQMRDGVGTWTAVTATSRDGSATDMAALVAALDGAVGSSSGPGPARSCSPSDHPMVLWLLDALDRAVRPTVAVDGCGAPTAALQAALDRLAVTDAVDRPVELLSATP